MIIGAIIQARMGSRRLPGKALMPLQGKPALQWVVEAVERAPNLVETVVATSHDASDEPIERFCLERNIECFRGSLQDVAGRFLGVLEQYSWDAAARISGDSPLLDWRLIEEAVKLYRSGDWHLVTNILPRTYPHGQSIEVVGASALRVAYENFSAAENFAHVTQYFYTHIADWRIGSMISEINLSEIRMALDTPADLNRIKKLTMRLNRPLADYTVADLVALHEHVPA